MSRKVVYNRCFGGFSLSEEAIQRYFQLKGWELLVVPGDFGINYHFKGPFPDGITVENAVEHIDELDDSYWYDRYVDRDDPILVQVVEELGEKADGSFARLAIAEVEGPYRIDEYDGQESVMEPKDYTWS